VRIVTPQLRIRTSATGSVQEVKEASPLCEIGSTNKHELPLATRV
jgi:hypothetical protein